MREEDSLLLKHIIQNTSAAGISVLLEGRPYIGLMPFAVAPDFQTAYVLASGLAMHTPGLAAGAPVSLLIRQRDFPQQDPFQIPRATFNATSNPMDKSTSAYTAAQKIYANKYPSSDNIFPLADFRLHALQFSSCRFIAGFGAAYNLTPDDLRKLSQKRGNS